MPPRRASRGSTSASARGEGQPRRHAGLVIVAGEADFARTPAATRSVADGEAFAIAGLAFQALHTPGHTPGHTCFHIDGDGRPGLAGPLQGALFTGDCLFVGGCGRLLEGTPQEMRASLAKISRLDPSTRIFSGHERAAGVARPRRAFRGSSCSFDDAPSARVEGRP